MTDTEKTYDELLMALDPKIRPAVAKARNTQLRARKAQETWYTESREFRAHIRSLHHRHGMSKAEIGRVLGISKTRVSQLLGVK